MAKTLKYCSVSSDNELFTETFPIPDVHLGEFLLKRLDAHGDKDLYINYQTGGRMTAAEAKKTALKLAAFLEKSGVSQGDIILGYAFNHEVYACCLLACSCIGAIFTGCMSVFTKSEVEKQLQDTRAKVILSCTKKLDVCAKLADEKDFVGMVVVVDSLAKDVLSSTAKGKRVVTIGKILESNLSASHLPVVITTRPSQTTAAICYSSGTTGPPKGVIKTHANLIASCMDGGEWIPTVGFKGRNDVATFHQPMANIAGVIFAVNSMYAGNTCIMNPAFVVKDWLEIVQKFRVTHTFLSPTGLLLVSKSNLVREYDVSSLERVVTSGAPVSQTLAESFIQKLDLKLLIQEYGATEFGLLCKTPEGLTNNYTTTGVPICNMRYKIVDRQTGLAAGEGVVGEVYCKGNQVTPGYYHRPDADEENFTKEDDPWLMTGDAAYYDGDGLLYIVDRYKELIKVDSFQVSPSELEAILIQHEAVLEAAVIGVPDRLKGQVPKAFVVVKEGMHATGEGIMGFVNGKVAEFKAIKHVHFLETMPKISIGKIDRNKLKREFL